MDRSLVWNASVAGFATVLVFFHPDLYPYGPVVGGLLLGVRYAETPGRGAKVGIDLGLAALPFAAVATALVTATTLSTLDTGIGTLFISMDNSGPKGPLLSLLVVYVITVYSMIFGGLIGVLVGGTRTIRQAGDLTELLSLDLSPNGPLFDRDTPLLVRGRNGRSPFVRGAFFIVASVLAVLLFWWFEGFRRHMRGDARAFPERCTTLVTTPIDWVTSFQVLRLTFQLPYCGVYELGGVIGWVWVQIAMWGLSCMLVYRAGVHLFDDELTGLLGGLLLVTVWETFRFAIRPQDDMTMVFTLTLALYAISRERAIGGRWSRVFVAVALILFSFSRPLALLLGLGWIGLQIGERLRKGDMSLRSPTVLSLGTTAVVLFAVFLLKWVPKQVDLSHVGRDIHGGGTLVEAWANGIVVTHHTDPTFHYQYVPRTATTILGWILGNADHIFVMALFKATFFFVPVLPRWSTFHIVVNAVTLFPLIVMATAGTARLLKRRQFGIALVLLVPIFANVMTISVFYLDGGFNYRIPSSPSFALLAGYWLRTALIDRGLFDWIVEIAASRR